MIADPHQLYTQKLHHLYRRGGTALLVHLLNAALLGALLWSEVPAPTLVLWLVGSIAAGVIHWAAGRSYLRRLNQPNSMCTTIPHVAAAGLAGLGWGSAVVLLADCTLTGRVLIILMLGVQAAGAMHRLAALSAAYLAYLTGILAPLISTLALIEGEPSLIALPILLLLGASLLLWAHYQHIDLMDELVSRFGLEHKAAEDKLTGIPNRRRFDEILDRQWRQAARMEIPLSLILVDIDHFKKFNDRYGHLAGDDCLRQVAQALAKNVKRAGDLIARYGGEELAVLLFHMTRDDTYALAERLRRAVAELGIPHVDSTTGYVTVSLGGVTQIPHAGLSPEAFIKAADEALYRAKAAGRNCVIWHSQLPPTLRVVR